MSESFDAGWLDLREPIDHASRAADLLPPLVEWWTVRGASTVLDLGCGTGSNLRYLARRLPGAREWTLLDRDAELLAAIGPRMDASTADGREQAPALASRTGDKVLRIVQGDLANRGLEEVAGSHLVTASALLDLVSESWLSALADRCTRAGAAVLFALSYDGVIEWAGPPHPLDAGVRAAVNAHQRTDKGLGPALGPRAAGVAERLFRERGYGTRLVPSPWVLGQDHADLARALVEGWCGAACEEVLHPADGAMPSGADEVRAWADRRLSAVGTAGFGLTVGHQDLLALPPGPTRPS